MSMRIFTSAALAVVFFTGLATSASAQMSHQPWTFSQQNRASIAALMQQTEHPEASTAVSPGDTLICGGGTGQSSATANSTCIILSQATGDIQLGQDSQGSQTSSSMDTSTQTQASSSSGADAILSTLSGPASPAK